jgi:UDP-GlcNAc:undecaprenyl-phosphate/decaprenyl-phosphate GlcNAc-1-phosphate transferase
MIQYGITGAAAFLFSLFLYWLLKTVWKRRSITNLASVQKSDRWSKDYGIPLVGGIVAAAALAGFIGCILAFSGFRIPFPLLVSLGCAFGMFLLGLFDDLFELKSYQKFAGQIVIILVCIAFGVQAKITGTVFDLAISFFWYLGITNAFNLIDNMDGLSGGIALIAFGFLGYYFFVDGEVLYLIFCIVLGASLSAFLLFNFKPAKIYMGDNGSLFFGFLLALFTIVGSNSKVSGQSIIGVIVFPVLLMLIPIFDTALVSITRKRRGQSPFQGGKDHLSHRLVMLGMSERQAVLFLYAVSFLLGFLFIVLREVKFLPAIIIYFLIVLFVVLFGIYVGKIRIRSGEGEKKENGGDAGGLSLKKTVLYKSQIVKISADLIIVAIAYYFSFLLRYGGDVPRGDMAVFRQTVVFIVLGKMIAFIVFRVYRTGSKFYSFQEIVSVVKAVTIVNFGAILLFTIWRSKFGGISRGVFVIDWMLCILAVGGVKVFIRFFDELFFPLRTKNAKPLIFVGSMENYKILERILHMKNITDFKIEAWYRRFEEALHEKGERNDAVYVSDISPEKVPEGTVRFTDFMGDILRGKGKE